MTEYRKKLIEVALPLEAINRESAREKSIRYGHPSTLHLWWARRPLAAARAVIFAQMVDDPSSYLDELRADPLLSRKAELTHQSRVKAWEEARSLADEAERAGRSVAHPGLPPTLDDALADEERQRLFRIMEDLVLWENTINERVLQAARDEIWRSWRRTCADSAEIPSADDMFSDQKLPAFHDPFCGGGALPLEAQRLGLVSCASDLNPVAVLLGKAMLEVPPRFAGRPPVNPEFRQAGSLLGGVSSGVQGLAEDVRYYGRWVGEEAERRIGYLYPKVEITAGMASEQPELRKYVGRTLTVIAWIWSRTVRSPNPAFAQYEVPLASTFMLSTKPGREAYVEPLIEPDGYRFLVRAGRPADVERVKLGTTAGKRAGFRCLLSGVPITYDYIRDEGKSGRMGIRLMATVAEGDRERVFLPPTPEMEAVAASARPTWIPDLELPGNTRDFKTPNYGLNTFGDLFTPRQLVALTTFLELTQEAREQVRRDALSAGLSSDDRSAGEGGQGAAAYADAVTLYLALAVDRVIERHTTIAIWDSSPTKLQLANTFRRQAIPMTWDFAEGNPLCTSSGTWSPSVEWVARSVAMLPGSPSASALQLDASSQSASKNCVVSTDPPYYDNIGYADLSDFFYIWLRKSLGSVFPDLFGTLAVPKGQELVATPYRHGGKEKAEAFFLEGMSRAMNRLATQAHPAFPVTIYYAFKQTETRGDGDVASTGWDTFLAAVMDAGFAITGTWPLRTELTVALKKNSASLASSIVIVCRKRRSDAPIATRREFISSLAGELPSALAHLQRENIAPVDLAQAAIGPGMAVFSRYAKIVEADGSSMTVRTALGLINQALDEILSEQEGEFDADTRWALAWFEQFGIQSGEFGVAETLSKAKGTSVGGMVEAGFLEARAGKVRLLRRDELDEKWNPVEDSRLTVWEMAQNLVKRLEVGEVAAAALAHQLGAFAEVARDLAYRLFLICERKKWAQEALAYNALVVAWPQIQQLAAVEPGAAGPSQTSLTL